MQLSLELTDSLIENLYTDLSNVYISAQNKTFNCNTFS